jgi:glycerophosphoryl diester phosphodiesterase
VNEPEDMRRLLLLGVDGLVTDRADVGLGVAAERA